MQPELRHQLGVRRSVPQPTEDLPLLGANLVLPDQQEEPRWGPAQIYSG